MIMHCRYEYGFMERVDWMVFDFETTLCIDF